MAIISTPLQTYNPDVWKHPNPVKGELPPGAPSTAVANFPTPIITKEDTLDTLREILRLASLWMNLFGIFAFVSFPTGQTVIQNNVRHYYEMVDLIEIFIDYLDGSKNNSKHPGVNYSSRNRSYRKLYYIWRENWKKYYISPYKRFRNCFKDVINIIGLPICALRIRTMDKGLANFPGVVVRYKPDGTKMEDTDWKTFIRSLSGKYLYLHFYNRSFITKITLTIEHFSSKMNGVVESLVLFHHSTRQQLTSCGMYLS